MYTVGCYLAYLLISMAITIWVARTLHKNGRVFLVDSFGGNAEIADSINHLLVVGFYLINIGWITVTLRTAGDLQDFRSTLELLSEKTGGVLLVLGIIHFGNIFAFSRMRNRALAQRQPQLPA